ncbi:MAG: hypothetical protein ACOC0B_01920, partial [bacterium]
MVTSLSVAILLAGCENLIQGLDDLEPGTVRASTGEYDDRIEITWAEVVDSDGDEREAEEYEVFREKWDDQKNEWDSEGEITGTETVEETSYTDRGVDPGTPYRYSVLAVFPESEDCRLPCDPAEPTEYAEGYAMSADGLTIHPEEDSSEGEESFDASGSDRWFEFAAQQGWTYTVEVSDTGSGNDDIAIYRRGNIRIFESAGDNPGTTTFTAEETSVYHI